MTEDYVRKHTLAVTVAVATRNWYLYEAAYNKSLPMPYPMQTFVDHAYDYGLYRIGVLR